MDTIRVMTPCGPGIIWGIGPGKVLVEMDYSYLVEFEPGDVERIEREACGRADHINLERLPDFCRFLYSEAPHNCHGSPEAVKAWLKRGEDESDEAKPIDPA